MERKKEKVYKFEERCKECGIGIMIHDSLYHYKCSRKECGYSYRIEPSAPIGKRTVFEKFMNED